jgi:hypothetical protein
MIKINLLPQKRAKRARPGQRAPVAQTGDSGAKYVLIGWARSSEPPRWCSSRSTCRCATRSPMPRRRITGGRRIAKRATRLDLKSYDLLVQQKADAVKKISRSTAAR